MASSIFGLKYFDCFGKLGERVPAACIQLPRGQKAPVSISGLLGCYLCSKGEQTPTSGARDRLFDAYGAAFGCCYPFTIGSEEEVIEQLIAGGESQCL